MPLDNCNLCGACKEVCPVYKIVKKETVSPRGKSILIKKDIIDKTFYICTLCGACKEICPNKVDLPSHIKKRRTLLVESGVESKRNREMAENIRNKGHPHPGTEETTEEVEEEK